MSDKPEPVETWHGCTKEDIARAVLRMGARLDEIARLPGGPEARLKALDEAYFKGSHIERMALREAAFYRVCGVTG